MHLNQTLFSFITTLSLVFLHLRTFAAGQQYLSPADVYAGIQQNLFDLIMDVRTVDEWNQGHIPNATLVESLSLQSTIPLGLQGCEGACRTIVVYCRSGARAGVAIDLMLANGFNGTVFNGRGTSQWVSAGYDLVNDDSVDAKCSIEVDTALPCEEPIEEEQVMTPAEEEEDVTMIIDEEGKVTTTTSETKDSTNSASFFHHHHHGLLLLCGVFLFYLF